MPIKQKSRTVREAVGVFHRSEELQAAIDELLQSGFHRAELSLLASEHAVDQKLGHRYRKVSSLEDDPVIPRAAYVSQEAIGGAEGGLIGILLYIGAVAAAGAVVASGGTLTAAIIGATLSGGAKCDPRHAPMPTRHRRVRRRCTVIADVIRARRTRPNTRRRDRPFVDRIPQRSHARA